MIAIIPAFIITLIYGETGVTSLLILSQVILSMQLSFAVVPLVQFTSDRKKMGKFVNKAWLKITVYLISVIIICFNAYLLLETFKEWFS